MVGLIVGISVVLILVILFAIFRILKLINIAQSHDKREGAPGNKINAMLMMAFLIVFGGIMIWYSVAEFETYTLPVASDHGIVIDRIFWVTMVVTGVVFMITQILLFYFSYRYQYKGDQKALYYPDNSKLEVLWTVIPAIVLSLLVFYGWKAWTDITAKAPDDAEVVEILGSQFNWNVRYPGKDNRLGSYDYRLIDAENLWGMDFTDKASFDDFDALEIHIPKGKPVLFKIRARDVLHSVYVPELRLKMDAVPGMPTNFWFVANKSTAEMREELNDPDFTYHIYCAELCGRGHFSMRANLVVDEPEDYEAWKAEQKPWLQNHADYLAKVPHSLKEVALISAGLDGPGLDRSGLDESNLDESDLEQTEKEKDVNVEMKESETNKL